MNTCERPRRMEYNEKKPLAMAYVPWQYLKDVYEPDQALRYGTIFPELDKPFLGKRGACQV